MKSFRKLDLVRVLIIYSLVALLPACGGSSSSSEPPPKAKVTITINGVAQKGPLVKNSTVTAQELNAALSPTGKLYSYQITDDLGRFTPDATQYTSLFIGLNANGYYYDEVLNVISTGPLALQGIADLNTDTVMNVNLLSTLAYNRIKTLVGTGMTVAAARTQAEAEVLKAFYIYNGNAFGNFGSMDIASHRAGDNILAAISSLFVNGNNAGNLSVLMADFQSDIADNGVIDIASIRSALVVSAQVLSSASVASNLTAKYASVTTAYAVTDISDWIDNDGDGVIGKYEFKVPNAAPSTAYSIPYSIVDLLAGSSVTVSAGTMSVNGVAAISAVAVKSGDLVTITPPAGAFPFGGLKVYLSQGSVKMARVTFQSGVQSIAVTPANAGIPKGLTQGLNATATYADGSTADVTGQASWASNNTAVATVNASGIVQGMSIGSATLAASYGGVTGSTTVNIVAPVLQSITVSNPAVSVSLTQQLTATGTYSDGTTQPLTTGLTWSSATPAVATVDATGVVTGIALGKSVITVTSGAISGSATITVTLATLQSIAVTPAAPAVAKGLTQQFIATGTYSDGTTQTFTGITWSSGTTGVATINGTGMASTLTPGTTLITATSGAISGSTTLTVGPAALTSISVSNPRIALGQSQQLSATGVYSDTTTADITNSVSWTSASPGVATVSASGLATGVAVGTASITATSGAISGSAVINIIVRVAKIIAGPGHTVALKSDGTMWAWGNNSAGQLGDGTTVGKTSPTQIGTGTTWSAISVGSLHTVALKSDGTMWAWGNNSLGQLGDGTTISKTTPTQIGTGNTWSAISVGTWYTVALKSDGTVWAWGDNFNGQLGDGTTVGKTTPTQIGTGNTWRAISVGNSHTIALKSDGTVWAWGNNGFGQLGDGTTISKTTPTQIGTGTTWSAISAGNNEYNTFALKSDGTVWAWGRNNYGQLGDGTKVNKTTPTQIGTGTTWSAISAGGLHTVALKSDGTVWAWGYNYYGQLGDGNPADKTTPTQIGTGTTWSAISAGGMHTFALKSDGTVWAWGNNGYGQLGDGTTVGKTTPTQIIF